VVSTNRNWSGSPLKAILSKEVRIVWRIVRPATKDDMFSKTISALQIGGLTIANTIDFFIGEDSSFMIVGPVTCLFNERRRKAVSIGLVVRKFRVNVIVDLNFS